MKRYSWSVVSLTVLMLTSTAWSQSNSSVIAAASAVSSLSATTTTQPATDVGQAIRQELRGTLAQVFVGVIQQFFGNVRTLLGLPAGLADPLAILETTIENAVSIAVGQ